MWLNIINGFKYKWMDNNVIKYNFLRSVHKKHLMLLCVNNKSLQYIKDGKVDEKTLTSCSQNIFRTQSEGLYDIFVTKRY